VIPEATPEFVWRMEEVLDVYERPYDDDHPVIGLDESPVQLVAETRTGFVDSSGVEHYDYEYQRHGVADLCMICEPLSGRREVLIRERHDHLSYGRALLHICQQMYPTQSQITIIEDNHSAHMLSAVYELLEPEQARAMLRRIRIVRTPKHGSWLNVAEIELSVLRRQCLPERIDNREALEREVTAWSQRRNDSSTKIDWQFTAADARIKLKRLYPSIIT
jgi:hypothetical protein